METQILDKLQLMDGEKLLWEGRPKFKIFSKLDILFVPITLLLAQLLPYFFKSIKFFLGAFVLNITIILVLLMACFIYFLMFYFSINYILVRFFYKYYIISKSYYFLTNERALILKRIKHETLTSIVFGQSTCINIDHNSNGMGTIIFSDEKISAYLYPDSSGVKQVKFGFRGKGKLIDQAFYNIKDAYDVYDLIEKIAFND